VTTRIATPLATPVVDGKPSPGRFRFAVLLAATIATLLLLWLFGKAADIFLLVFIASLFAVYLGAVTDEIVKRLPVSRPFAFAIAIFFTLALITALGATLIPPLVEETQALIRGPALP